MRWVAPSGVARVYKRTGSIQATAILMDTDEETVRAMLDVCDERVKRQKEHEEQLAKIKRREPDSLPNALLSTIAVLGFVFFPITLVISLVFSSPKHKKRRF